MSPKTKLLVNAIRAIEDDLTGLLGEAWPPFHAHLGNYLALFEQGSEEEATVRDWIWQLFEQHPAAQTLLAEEMTRLQSRYGLEADWGQVRAPITSLPSETEPRRVTRYTDIACPRRVSLESQRVPVVLQLTVRAPKHSAAVAALTVQEALTVRVRLDAPAFDLLGPDEAEIEIRPDADSAPVVFYLRPFRVGESLLTFDFVQAGHPVGSITVPITVVAGEVIEEQQSQPLPSLHFDAHPDVPPPDLTLVISHQLDPKPALLFRLERADGRSQTFRPVDLTGSPGEYAAQLYTDLELLADERDPVHEEVKKKARVLTEEEADERLREIGQTLWNRLFPSDFHDLYATEREQWKNQSLLILSDEPTLPWELAWPYDTRQGNQGWGSDETPWCLTLRLTRWMRHDEQGEGIARGPRPALSLHRLALVVPEDSGLPDAFRERDDLRALMAAHGLEDASPAYATRRAVLALLKRGGYDWLHVAAHGSFSSDAPDADSALWLEEKQSLSPSALVGPDIESAIRGEQPAFVFNVCEVGRQAWGLTGIAGWANQLLRLHAGLLVAPLWIVNDNLAAEFTQAFYSALLAGETVGEAVRQGRRAALQTGNPTWLAYSVYGHPNARLESAPSGAGGGVF